MNEKVLLKVPSSNSEPLITPIDQSIANDQAANVPQDNQLNQAETALPFANKGFDAGVDADEESDPKNYIEKLTGKLAQKLRDYNKTETDSDLNKFVINSLVPASIPNMDSKDANDVIDKVKDNQNNDENKQKAETNNAAQEDQPIQQEESNNSEIDDLINEIINKKTPSKRTLNKMPFKSPKFK
jgi:hypothetical protein